MVNSGTGSQNVDRAASQCVSLNECCQHKALLDDLCRRGAVQNNEPRNDWHRQTQRMLCAVLESCPASWGH